MQPRNKIFGTAMKAEKEYFERLQNIVAVRSNVLYRIDLRLLTTILCSSITNPWSTDPKSVKRK